MDYRKGDRLRVTIEGNAVTDPYNDWIEMPGASIKTTFPGLVVSVEKIANETPFAPGVVVKDKAAPEKKYAVATDGYLDLATGEYIGEPEARFTPAQFEQVELPNA